MPDLQLYYVAGGTSFQLAVTDERNVIDLLDVGLPRIQHDETPRPYSHGSYHRGWRFGSRTFNLLFIDEATDRDEAWTHRGEWLRAFNPELGEGYLRAILSDLTERRIACRVVDGLDFSSDNFLAKSQCTQLVPVQLLATEPFWYNPTQQSATGNFAAGAVDISCVNAGDVPTWPIIEIAGEVVAPSITLVETSDSITLTGYTVAAGRTAIINADAGTVALDDGTRLWEYVPKTSNLFALERGTNTIRITATSGTSACTVRWYNRYLGLYSS